MAHSREPRAIAPEDELLLSALADQAAITLDHASRYRQLWRESQGARAQLETAARRKDEFLAMLSHELRNPLAAIVNALAVLRARMPEDSALERVHAAADRQTRHMTRLLDDLLDVSRVTQNKIVLDRRPVMLQELVEQALQAAEPLLAERRHEVAVDVAEQPLVVSGDADRLAQVLANLLTNAAKFTPPGGHVAVALEAGEGEAILRVRDDGIGIDPDLLPSIFEIFVQAHRESHRGDGGLGIGLSLVKRLVEMHGGTVEAFSAGRGSELVVRLPLIAPVA